MKSVKLAGAAGLALMLAACGGTSEESAASENAAAPAPAETSEVAADAAADGGHHDAGRPPIAFAQCKACHSVEPGVHVLGPSLAGIYGTKAADIEGFAFSPAMQESGLVWDEETLDRYLENPRAVVPGTTMAYFGLKDEEKRREVVEYLKTL